MNVRITVAVATDGSWCAGGHGDASGTAIDSASWIVDGLPGHVGAADYHIVHVAADVPLPSEPKVIHGVAGTIRKQAPEAIQ